ncbi:META domain/Domain of unknown function (DUF1935), putative [Trypanosoma equiperdum]|uniref:META domain containing protein n=2 Tax=Trypanozoon TaxID=39700 RepID=Q582E3_TRYB2|nr:hypothetical protein, conserved [Trypanosoma brucei brucei TREU927]XP_844896.1 hypothetical protein, conserved [Trypanosoma brucei brucei TREU927]XP_844899.1 hypothetical protein, conserved [Trypanosoma brucei brucei TREU927]AAX80424.1 hypothetical protein, conserved [Trypanosoma brucei]SCU69567.1 META domain/Domain of unknown function (DUF1935), putative [Trypanosoma equiperdum]AAX80427.1 hypothetical protein, conserved [Trypanosoma brucei]AAX80430.1 hypothetical protein, conserved [Trypa
MMDITALCGNYRLCEIDGKTCSEEVFIALEASGGGVEVVAMVGNTLCGRACVNGDRISANLTSTMRQVEEEMMRIESLLTCGFKAGFTCEQSDIILTLTGEQSVFTLERDVLCDIKFGEYTLCEFNGEPVASDEMVLTLLPAVVDGALVIAQFKNSLRGELELRNGRLRGVIASTMCEVDGSLKCAEEAFLSATRGDGIKVCSDDHRLVLKDDHNAFVYVLRPAIPENLVSEYLLKSFNGESVEAERRVMFRFSQSADGVGTDVVASVANTIRGKVRVDDGKLKSKVMSSRRKGNESEMRFENALKEGFKAGFSWSLDDTVLTLECDGNRLIFVKVAAVPCENGRPGYIGDKVSRCFKAHDDARVYRIINTVESKWAFYNDTTEYNFNVSVTFGRKSKVRGLANTSIETNEEGLTVASVSVAPGATEMFVAGDVNGYKCSYDAVHQ